MAHAATLGAGPHAGGERAHPPAARRPGTFPLEAILWHGGEAEAARQAVLHLTQVERDALVSFLDSL